MIGRLFGMKTLESVQAHMWRIRERTTRYNVSFDDMCLEMDRFIKRLWEGLDENNSFYLQNDFISWLWEEALINLPRCKLPSGTIKEAFDNINNLRHFRRFLCEA